MSNPSAGIIGVGFIGPTHVEALRRLGVNVVALSEQTEELAKSKALEMGIPKAYGDYKQLINDNEVDVVHICAPNYLHYRMAKEAVKAGKHVICEKPLAMNSKESSDLVNLAIEYGKVNAVCYNIRFYPLCLLVREMVRGGELGDIYFVTGSYLQDWLFFDTDWSWRVLPELGGELRAVADIGTHWLDLVSSVTGLEIKKVFADMKTFIPVRKKPKVEVGTFKGKELSFAEYEEHKITTEDYATVLMEFSNGGKGSLTVSQISAGRKNKLSFEIYGSKKSVAWSSETPNELWVGYREKPNELIIKDPSLLSGESKKYTSYPGGHTEGFPDTFKQLFKCVYDAVAKGIPDKPLYATFLDGHKELLICEAIKKSAQQNRWIEVEKF